MSLHIETTIQGSLDDLWHKTQDPTLHQQWDLRFSDITYLPKERPDAPQRFLYQTRIGLGMGIQGMGESRATRTDARGKRTSSLKFWSDAPISLIRDGAGYWQYEPTSQGIHFLTRYDYHTRFGWLGDKVDHFFFRPLMAWATAWSFDRLRLWVERGQSPQRSTVYTLGIIFLWVMLLGAWAVWALTPTLTTLVPLLGASLLMFMLHSYADPYLPSASRCTWRWS
jgi:hypothetical protein